MPSELKWTPAASRTFEKLEKEARSAKQEGIFKQVAKTVQLLSQNPRHPSLKTHKYDSLPHPYDASEAVFEAYAQNRTPGAYRVFWCYGPGRNTLTIVTITPHP